MEDAHENVKEANSFKLMECLKVLTKGACMRCRRRWSTWCPASG